ncbi:MAG: lysoplasmalogenase [Pseudonocardiales bacterium]|nr:lysoplasmalogenase [Actinomycetota bacterium]
MTPAFFVAAGMVGLGDWFAVGRHWWRMECVAKPLTIALIAVAACFADLGDAKPWVLAALLFGLLGDTALLFTDERRPIHESRPDLPFLLGLGSFLFGHLAYVVAFTRHGLHPVQLLAGGLVVVGAAALTLPRLLRGAREEGGALLTAAVATYTLALGAMVTLGFGTAAIATAVGALLFMASDLTLAWGRFVQPLLRGPVIVAVTYHLAQALIVVGLIA